MPGESNLGLLRRYATASAALVAIWLLLLESLGGFLPFGPDPFSGGAIVELTYLDYPMLARAAASSFLTFAAGFGAAAIVAWLLAVLHQRSPAVGNFIALPFVSLGAAPLVIFMPFVVFFFGIGAVSGTVMIFLVAAAAIARPMLLAAAEERGPTLEGAFALATLGGFSEPRSYIQLQLATALRSNVLYVFAAGLFSEFLAGVDGLGRVVYVAALNHLDAIVAMAAALLYALGGMAIVFALEALELAVLRRRQE
jgi:ABC-type nitrate/sulfonate/bicarbonate transport system permease component